MSIIQIQDKVKQVLEKFSSKNFIYDLLLAYNPPATLVFYFPKYLKIIDLHIDKGTV